MAMTSVELDYRDRELDKILGRQGLPWRRFFASNSDFKKIDDCNFILDAFTVVGRTCLLFACTAKTPTEVEADYFPVSIDEVDASYVQKPKWFALASSGDHSGMSGRLQWLFDRPAIYPIEEDDTIRTNRGNPNETTFHVRFYGGVEIVSADETARLRFMVSQLAEFTMRMQLIGC